jgi:hypothetical protein
MANIRITVKVPEIVLNSDFILTRISQKMKSKTGPDLRALFRRTVEGWDNPPDFSQKFHVGRDYCSTTVWPSGRNKNQYNLVNEGSPPHIILPRRARMLRFQVGYRAATKPRVIGSSAKQRFGPYTGSAGVAHPGFEAREFDSAIAEEYQDTFAADMQDAINVAVVRK